MSNEKIFDPFFGFNQLSGMLDKQLNGLLYNLTNNKELVRTASFGLNTYSSNLERLRKNQELIATVLNIPTKKDVANAAKLSIQTEEKIDILEEQIWKLQDSVSSINKGNLGMFEEIENIVTQMKNEFQKLAQEVAETKKMKEDLHVLRSEWKKGISQLSEIKTELAKLSGLIGKEGEKQKKAPEKMQDKELVLTGTNTTR
ncbi:polyhydroxyalkanoate biosynthesis repressor PhaR [Neobacillus cucumis]|uniref:polyhydroxyalkanoate biosynthesis repressor PhaR n=1 Tax=Neobacillus cucumis TaxID=1740721 RepID=UPI0018DFBD0E|nr:polyhydroxyalkanoate biosynthesis repressor PhaR [Neobacillus cucumis]MBI0580036.1 polyhydroxyalkanoate biosynthesis repressor PhaR [Neobacillus cucumis]